MKSLVITSITGDHHPVLKKYARQCKFKKMPFIVIGDVKSPTHFSIDGCDYWDLKKQATLPFTLASVAPQNHYSRKNLGYLIAIKNGATEIIETDEDNIPCKDFWKQKKDSVTGHVFKNAGWINIYSYFTKQKIWPRGFPLNKLQKSKPTLPPKRDRVYCPIQQGLSDKNPDVDAIYRLTLPLLITFETKTSVVIGVNSWCPFNSQNTTWFRKAFPLLYLPSYCSFRMTDIWRSFIAQRIAWECGWSILFHAPTVYQMRNPHDLMKDFADEIPGYLYNSMIVEELEKLTLKSGEEYIIDNLLLCYKKLIELNIFEKQELKLLKAWIKDISQLCLQK